MNRTLTTALAALILATFACGNGDVEPVNHDVIYYVRGTASTVSLTYENESGNTEQKDGVELPWRKMMSVEDGAFLYISAQNEQDSGSVVCEILVDGVKMEEASSSGAYVIATCSGQVGE